MQTFSNFADLAEHYAREIATPDYAAAFMEQTELAKLSIEHEPSAAEMPDPEAAQAAIEMMLATVFDLFRDTRMEDMASEVAWGIANSFHVVAVLVGVRRGEEPCKACVPRRAARLGPGSHGPGHDR